jgi:hypothetical protein
LFSGIKAKRVQRDYTEELSRLCRLLMSQGCKLGKPDLLRFHEQAWGHALHKNRLMHVSAEHPAAMANFDSFLRARDVDWDSLSPESWLDRRAKAQQH